MLITADITGHQFGLLTVLRKQEGSGKTKYLCRCSCGKEKVVLENSLRTNNTRSCGCTHERGLSPWDSIKNTILSSYIRNAKNREIHFDLQKILLILLEFSEGSYCLCRQY